MKRLIILIAFVLSASGAWAADQVLKGNPDLQESPLLEHTPGEKMHAQQMGYGDQYGSPLIEQPSDHTHMKGEGGQPGEGDRYGSVLLDQER